MVWTPSPAPRALSALQTEVGNYIQAPVDTTLAAVIVDALNDGLRRLNTRARWPWSLASESVALVTGTADYVLTTNAAHKVRKVYLANSSGVETGEIRFMDPHTFADAFFDRSASGAPSYYTVRNMIADGTLSLSVPPNAGFVATYPKLKVLILKRLTMFSSGSTSDTLTTLGGASPEAENFLAWNAKAYMATINDPSKAQFAQGRAEEAWRALLKDSNEDEDFD